MPLLQRGEGVQASPRTSAPPSSAGSSHSFSSSVSSRSGAPLRRLRSSSSLRQLRGATEAESPSALGVAFAIVSGATPPPATNTSPACACAGGAMLPTLSKDDERLIQRVAPSSRACVVDYRIARTSAPLRRPPELARRLCTRRRVRLLDHSQSVASEWKGPMQRQGSLRRGRTTMGQNENRAADARSVAPRGQKPGGTDRNIGTRLPRAGIIQRPPGLSRVFP